MSNMYNSTVSPSPFHQNKRAFFVSASCGLKAEKILENQIKKLALLGLGSQNCLHQQISPTNSFPTFLGFPVPNSSLKNTGTQGEVKLVNVAIFLLEMQVFFEVLLFQLRAASWRHPRQLEVSPKPPSTAPKTPVLHNVFRNLAQPFQLQDNRLRLYIEGRETR